MGKKIENGTFRKNRKIEKNPGKNQTNRKRENRKKSGKNIKKIENRKIGKNPEKMGKFGNSKIRKKFRILKFSA